jgi:hypothetical protein
MVPVPESDLVLAELAGRGASEAFLGPATFTKELQKTGIEPARPLAETSPN